MEKSMDIQVIEAKIVKMEKVKQNLLKLKKEDRQTTLQEVNGIISRLKGWLKDLEKKSPCQ